jgi:hypothetical protein
MVGTQAEGAGANCCFPALVRSIAVCLEVYLCQRFEAGIHVSNGFSSLVWF